jgi:hypothetical protein
MHQHKRSIVHQRELHSDTPSFALALRAALRQAPKVILVGEMRDKETVEIALEAAETGHQAGVRRGESAFGRHWLPRIEPGPIEAPWASPGPVAGLWARTRAQARLHA